MGMRWLAVAALMFASVASGKNLYVNNSGSPACSDATTYAANDAANPWCTIGRAAWGSTSYGAPSAAQAAAASDVVLITAGTYTTAGNASPSSCRWLVALNPANSGTAGNLITFRGVGVVTINLGSGSYGPTIGADNRNYIVWDNVRIDEQAAAGTSCSDTGPVVFHDTTGSKLINSVVRGTYRSWADNYNGIRTETANSVTISGNELYDFTGNFGHNTAAIMMYDTESLVVEHNYIHDTVTGIYVKGDHAADGWPQQNNTIRLNWFQDISNKCVFLYSATGTRVYQNIIKGCSSFAIYLAAATENTDIKIVNNTIIDTTANSAAAYSLTGSDTSALTGHQFYNNVIYGAFGEAINIGGLAIGSQTFEHNVYYGMDAFGSVSGAQRTFAVWQGTYGQDSVTPAGVESDPLFISTTYPGGYKLNVGSPALARGIDILDLDGDSSTSDTIAAGAYVTGSEVIGPTNASTLAAPGRPRWRPLWWAWWLWLDNLSVN